MAIKFCCKVDFSATKTVGLIQKAYGAAVLSRNNSFLSGKKVSERVEFQWRTTKSSGRAPQQVEPMTTSSPSSTECSKNIIKLC